MNYKQCTLQKGKENQVTWIPESFVNAQKGEISFGGNNNTLDSNNKYNFEFYNSYISTDSHISLTPFFLGDMNTTVGLSVMIGSQSSGFCQIGVRNLNSAATDMSQIKIKFCIF